MPHLQFELNRSQEDQTKLDFSEAIRNSFARIMDTGTDHIAVSIREYGQCNLSIGRASPGEAICLMNLDIREGRSREQRRRLALDFMDIIQSLFNIHPVHQYITFTQHPGEDFHLAEKYLAEWVPKEDPLA